MRAGRATQGAPRLVYRRLPEPLPNSPRRYGWFVKGPGLEIGIQPSEAGILLAAMLARAPVRCADFVEALWGEDPEGGPLSAEKAVHVYVCRLNSALRAFGWHIRGRRSGGGYSLVRLGRAQGRRPGRQAAPGTAELNRKGLQ